MTKREMMSLLIKLMGVYALVQLVPGVVSVLGAIAGLVFKFKEQPIVTLSVTWLSMLAAPLLWIGLCIWVIRKSDHIAKWLYPIDASAGQLTTLNVKDIQHLGYHFIGLLLVVKAFPSFAMMLYQSIMIILFNQSLELQNKTTFAYRQQWVMLSLQLAIGLYLFLRPRGLANLRAKIQGKVPDYECSDSQENKKVDN